MLSAFSAAYSGCSAEYNVNGASRLLYLTSVDAKPNEQPPKKSLDFIGFLCVTATILAIKNTIAVLLMNVTVATCTF